MKTNVDLDDVFRIETQRIRREQEIPLNKDNRTYKKVAARIAKLARFRELTDEVQKTFEKIFLGSQVVREKVLKLNGDNNRMASCMRFFLFHFLPKISVESLFITSSIGNCPRFPLSRLSRVTIFASTSLSPMTTQ